jgi:hypothetical protein
MDLVLSYGDAILIILRQNFVCFSSLPSIGPLNASIVLSETQDTDFWRECSIKLAVWFWAPYSIHNFVQLCEALCLEICTIKDHCWEIIVGQLRCTILYSENCWSEKEKGICHLAKSSAILSFYAMVFVKRNGNPFFKELGSILFLTQFEFQVLLSDWYLSYVKYCIWFQLYIKVNETGTFHVLWSVINKNDVETFWTKILSRRSLTGEI